VVGEARTAADPAKLTSPDVDVVGQLVDEPLGGVGGRLHAVGFDVLGFHRDRGVDGDDDGGALSRDAELDLRSRGRGAQQYQGEQCQAAGEVRRQPGRSGTTLSSRGRAAKRTAYRSRRLPQDERCDTQRGDG
jgi:hypothetical protein